MLKIIDEINLGSRQKNKVRIRYEKILNSALELFLERGFENTSLSDIVAKSGGSLATIYKLFDNKEKLFETSLKFAMAKFYDDELLKTDENLPLEEFLIEFGIKYATNYIFSKEQLLITRIIITNGYNKKAELSKIHNENFLLKPIEILKSYLSKPEISSQFKDENLTEISHRFCSIFHSYIFVQAILSMKIIRFSMSASKIRKMVQKSVDIFLNGEIKI